MPLRKTRKTSAEIIRKAYKFQSVPTEEQKVVFAQTFGCVRYLYNRMLDDKSKAYRYFGENLNLTPAWYKHISCCRWLADVDALALANVQLNLSTAFQNFFKKRAKYPKFKKKNDHHDSYTTNVVNGNISYRTSDKYMYVTLPKIPGELMVKNHRPVKQGGNLKSVTVSREPSGKYYISLLFEYTKVKAVHDIDPDNAIGLDMSMRSFYVDSDGNEVDSPHAYLHAQDRLAREQRKLSHMKKGSSNYQKQKLKIAKLYAKTTHQRNDFLHKLSRKLVDAYDIVGIEDLDMKGMSQALNFGKSVSDKGWGRFVRMITYKATDAGKRVIKISRWFPSSQMCHECGCLSKKTKDLSVREWTCPHCSTTHNRDYNAAINIKNEAVRIYCTQ